MFLRVWDLGGPSLSVDEGMSWLVSDFWRSARDWDVHPPGFFAALRLWRWLGGNSELWLRLLPALAGWLCLPVLYWLCLETRRSPAVPVWLLAVSCYHVQYSRELRMYPLLSLLALLGLAALSRGLHGPREWPWLGLASLAFCLADWMHYFGLLVPFVGLALVRSRDRLARWALTAGFSLLGFAPWLGGFRSPAQDLTLRTRPGLQDLLELWGRMMAGDYGPSGSVAYALVGAAVLVLAIWRGRQESLVLAWVLAAPVLVWLISLLTWLRIFEFKYFVWCVPGLTLLLPARWPVALAFTALNLTVWGLLVLDSEGAGQNWREAALLLRQRQAGAVVLVHPSMMAAPLLYYGILPGDMHPTDAFDPAALAGANEVWTVSTPYHPLAVRVQLERNLEQMGWKPESANHEPRLILPSAVVRVVRWRKGSP